MPKALILQVILPSCFFLALILICTPLTLTFSHCLYLLENLIFYQLCLILHMAAIGAELAALLLGPGSCNPQLLLITLVSWRRPLSMAPVLLLITA